MNFSTSEQSFMWHALALASQGKGLTAPNPCVGAVVVRNGIIVGEGFHPAAGQPHAEIHALQAAGRRSKGATLFVTLEPCSTFGRTPPCTSSIINAGIKEVIYAVTDPNPSHEGRAKAVLQAAGIRVRTGLLEKESSRLNVDFNHWIRTGVPWVVAKSAMSLDGRIATRTHDSKWITSEEAREKGHELRHQAGAIIIGANTVRHDDPELSVRYRKAFHQPLRVVLSSDARFAGKYRIFQNQKQKPTLLALPASRSGKPLPPSIRNIQCEYFPLFEGRIDLKAVLRHLGRKGIINVLLEGGGTVLGDAFKRKLVNEVHFFYAPIIIGGNDAVPSVGGAGARTIAESIRFKSHQWNTLSSGILEFEGFL